MTGVGSKPPSGPLRVLRLLSLLSESCLVGSWWRSRLPDGSYITIFGDGEAKLNGTFHDGLFAVPTDDAEDVGVGGIGNEPRFFFALTSNLATPDEQRHILKTGTAQLLHLLLGPLCLLFGNITRPDGWRLTIGLLPGMIPVEPHRRNVNAALVAWLADHCPRIAHDLSGYFP